MTTTIRIEAHCTKDKEVRVITDSTKGQQSCFMQDGESLTTSIYDDMRITVNEQLKRLDAE